MINTTKGNKTAISFGNQTISYREVINRSAGIAQLFKNKPPEKVAIFSRNRPEWIYAFYAAWQYESTVVTIDFMSSDDDVSYILNDCKPDYVFFSEDGQNTIDNIKQPFDNTTFVCFDDIKIEETESNFEWKTPDNTDKTALIIYTSGTTGSPKGVMLSYTNLLVNIDAVSVEANIFRDDSEVLLFLPLHHIFPLLGSMVATLFTGGTIVMSTGMQSTDLMETLKNNNVSIFIGVPRLYELIYNGLKEKINAKLTGRVFFAIANALKSKGFSKTIFKKVHEGLGGNIECLVSGGAKLDSKIGNFFTTLGFDVYEGYGMTECAPMITFPRPGKIKIGTTGQALKNVEIKISDGEIIVKGPNVMKGYYNRPEETAEILRDGWLYTGDLGKVDKKGYLYITGRKKEIIVLPSGKNINPVLIESKLERLSAFVSEVAVFLNKGSLHGLIVPNYHKLSESNITDPHDFFKTKVIPEFNNTLTPYQRIMQFNLINQDIPRTRLGKIQRFKLEDILSNTAKGTKKRAKDPDTEEYKTIKVFIESQVQDEIAPDDHLEFDIALDSLGKLSLMDFIENTFGIEISQEKLLSFPSVRKLTEYISDNKLRHKIENINWSDILKEKTELKLPASSVLHPILNSISRAFFKVYFRYNGYGAENIPDSPVIIAPNHQSFFDGAFVSAFLKNRTLKNTYFYAKKKHIKNSFLRFMARNNNIIVVDLHNNLKDSILKLAEVLKQGKNIIIFPEGTRTKDGNMGDFKQTFAILSKELNVPVVPVAISGAYKALPSGKMIPKIFSKINVRFLDALYPEADNSYNDIADSVKGSIEDKLG